MKRSVYRNTDGTIEPQFYTQRVPCGKCINCLQRDAMATFIRLELESKVSDNTLFCTLTYAPEFRPVDVSKRHIKNFLKNIRRSTVDQPLKVKYLLISEYTPKHGYPHYHVVFFNVPDYIISHYWKFGFVDIEEILPERLMYVSSFHILKNLFVPEGCAENFRFISNGVGLEGFEKYELFNAGLNDWKYLFNDSGYRTIIPRYYRKKFGVKSPFTDDFRLQEYPKVSNRFQVIQYNETQKERLANYIFRKMSKKHM